MDFRQQFLQTVAAGPSGRRRMQEQRDMADKLTQLQIANLEKSLQPNPMQTAMNAANLKKVRLANQKAEQAMAQPQQPKVPEFLAKYMDPSQPVTREGLKVAYEQFRQDWMAQKNGNNQQMTPYQEAQIQRWEQQDNQEAAAVKQEEQGAQEFKQGTLTLINSMLDHDGLNDAVGTVDARFPTLRGDTQDFENKHNTLVARLTKENLGLMKGVLSDKDIQILTNIGAGELNLRSTEKSYKEALGKLKAALESEAAPQTDGWGIVY